MKRFLCFILAMALILSAGIPSVFADKPAEDILTKAEAEFQTWKDLGLLNEEVVFPTGDISVTADEEDNSVWASVADENGELRLQFREDSEKPVSLILTVFAREDEEPLENIRPIELGDRTLYYYDLFDRILAPEMTIGKYAALISGYYGYEKTPILSIIDTMDKPVEETADEEMLLKDLTWSNCYVLRMAYEDVTVYTECMLLPQSCMLWFGPTHTVG